MSKLTDIKQRIRQLEGGAFEDLCNAYLYKLGYENITSLGTKPGTLKTTKGIPDTYFIDSGEKYVFVMYTTQDHNLYKKIFEDICDCLKPEKTGIEIVNISEIIYCHNSSKLSAGNRKKLYDFCAEKGILLQLHGIDRIASKIYTQFHGISRDFLGIPISTEQIFEVDEFISTYDSNGMASPLSTIFQFREKEVSEVLEKIDTSKVVVITGPAGVGKTRLALECCQKYASDNEYRLFCIRSNRLPIYEDLKVYLDTPNNYLLLIDDGNEISGLQHILQYLTKYNQGYNVKIVVTVRDYAKLSIIQIIQNFYNPAICTINTFSDDEIKKLLEKNLKIVNTAFLEKIIRIAEGNARLAIMAGKLAIKEQSFNSIKDASQLYEGYYEKIVQNNILEQNRDLCSAAGIIAFLTAINLEYLDNLIPLLKQLNISKSDFVKCVFQLHDLELVDIYSDKAVKISDQSLGNYLLLYVFIKKRIIPLSTMIKVCFRNYRSRVIDSVNTLANIFASEDMYQQLEQDVSTVWDDLKNTKDPTFREFVKVFYRIRPTETFLIIKEKIDKLPQGSLDFSSIDFEKERQNHSVNDDILRILGGFSDSRDLPIALDLLFMYYKKTPQKFMKFYHTIVDSFGVRKKSHHYDYWTQVQLVNKFIEHADELIKIDVNFLFVKVSSELLKLKFTHTEAGRKNTILMYQIPVKLSDGSKKYRELIWNCLFELYCKDQLYRMEIERIIEDYGWFITDEVEKELVLFDSQFIFRFFDHCFSPNKLSHCIIAKKVMDHLIRIDLDATSDLSDYLNNSDFLIYKTLKGELRLKEFDFEKRQELKKAAIQELLLDCSEVKIQKIIKICSIYQESGRKNTWDLGNGLHYVFHQLALNKKLFIYAVNIYLSHNTPINLYPDPIVNKLFELVGIEETYKIINDNQFDQKNTWKFSFFKNLPVVSKRMVQELYDFLSEDDRNITSSPYRGIEFLNKYRKVDNDIYVKAGRIILSKYKNSRFMFSMYFHPAFSPYGHGSDPNLLWECFSNDLNLLREIYLKLITYDKNTDSDGQYLIYFVQKEITFIDEFIEVTLKKDNSVLPDDAAKRLSAIWNSDMYMQYANYIFNLLYNNEDLNKWGIETYIAYLFMSDDNSETINDRQDKRLSHFIENNCDNSEFMKIIFSSIAEAELSSERRRKHIVHLIKLNPDPQLFKEIELEPRGYGGIGSLIPYMEERMSFLKSLLPELGGISYLEHKQRVEQLIEAWRRRIEREQIDEVLSDL